MSLLSRIARWNAPLAERILRELADAIEALAGAQPATGTIYLFLKGGITTMTDVLDTQAPFHGAAAWVDAKGEPADLSDLAGPPVWAASNASACDVSADADGEGATFTVGTPNADGTPASSDITATATNQDGTTAVAAVTITVHSSEAVEGTITLDLPTP